MSSLPLGPLHGKSALRQWLVAARERQAGDALGSRHRIAGVVLLRASDGAALLQHRDDKPGLPHANLWVPPGGHCEAGESLLTCAEREFFEETGYRCGGLRFLVDLDVDDVPFSPPLRLTMYWDVYAGSQPVTCREGQALEFVSRTSVPGLAMPVYLVDVWDRALLAWHGDVGSTHAVATAGGDVRIDA